MKHIDNVNWSTNTYYIIPFELRNGGTFYLYNVGAEKFLCSGNNYGSHASVD